MPQRKGGNASNWRDRLPELAGFPLIPCGAGKDSKAPIDPATGRLATDWQTAAFEPEQIAAMNGVVRCVGTRCGPDAAGLLVIDVDGATASDWLRAKGCDPDTLQSWRINRSTDADRFKLALVVPEAHWPALIKGKVKIPTGDAEQIELFWTSGQVLLLGEHVKTGGFYSWTGSPMTVATAAGPWLALALELLGEPQAAPDPMPPPPAAAPDAVPLEALLGRDQAAEFTAGVGEGGRNDAAFRLAVGLLTAADAASAAGLPVHGDPEALLLAFARRCSPPLPESEALTCLRSAEGQQRTPDRGLKDRIRYQQRRRQSQRQAAQDHAAPRGEAPAEAPDAARPKTAEQKLEDLADTAAALLATKVAYAARLPLLRATAESLDLTIRDQELLAILTAARRRRANGGQDDMLQPGERLDLTPEPWAWDGMVLRGAFNLWVALPKVGKTSLVLAWLNAWFRHEPAFLDRTLIGPCPPVLIIGTDQGQADWGRMLQAIGWVDAAGTIGGPLVGMVHAGRPLHLDPEGIDRIAEIAQRHPGLVVVVDSLSACLMPLGLKEESPQIAEPVQDLMEQLEPHGATLVVIHHASKGRAGEGAASASRGSTALPAAASQILKLAPASANEADHRRLLTTQGRGGLPQSLVIQRDGPSWDLLGGAELLEREQSQADAESKLTERQLDTLREVRERWEDRQEKTTAAQLVEALELPGTDAERTARKTLLGLHQKGLLEMVARSQPGRGSRVNEFWPKANEPANGPPRVGAPETGSVGSVRSVGPPSREDPERSESLFSLSYQPTDPTDPTDHRTSAPTRGGDGRSVGSEPPWHAIAMALQLEHPDWLPAQIALRLGPDFRHVNGWMVKAFLSGTEPNPWERSAPARSQVKPQSAGLKPTPIEHPSGTADLR